MKIAFCAYQINCPPSAGLDVHVPHMARALVKRGHTVEILCRQVTVPEQLGVPHQRLKTYDTDIRKEDRPRRRQLRRALAYHRGVTDERMKVFRRQIDEGQFDACVYAGTEGLAWLSGLSGVARVWYSADDAALSAISQIGPWRGPSHWLGRFGEATAGGLYEFALRDACDAVWVVSARDKAWTSRLMPGPLIESIPNGVDSDYFSPIAAPQRQRRIVFWGNLSFAPNLEALEWFVPAVWDRLAKLEPDAEFLVIGRSPPDSLRTLLKHPQIRLLADVPDLRPEVCSSAVAVFPIKSGSGVKNKLLEGASMARALVVSPQVVNGLWLPDAPPWIAASRSDEWIDGIRRLWNAPGESLRLGQRAREWVTSYYNWERAARDAETSIERVLSGAARHRAGA